MNVIEQLSSTVNLHSALIHLTPSPKKIWHRNFEGLDYIIEFHNGRSQEAVVSPH